MREDAGFACIEYHNHGQQAASRAALQRGEPVTGRQPGPGWRQETDGRRYPPQPQQRQPIPSRQPGEPPKKRNRDRSWWPIIAAAIIGAIATIVAGLIANGAGALRISVSSAATPTVTVTPPPAATVTVTASNGSGGVGSASCLSGQNCKVTNLTVPLQSGGSTAINLEQGQVQLNNVGDLNFQAASDGTPELTGYFAKAYSLDVTAQNAGKQQCQNATNTAPDASPITDFHTGLLVCASVGNGIALIRQTQPLGSSNTLYLQETYWPNSS